MYMESSGLLGEATSSIRPPRPLEMLDFEWKSDSRFSFVQRWMFDVRVFLD